MAGKATHIAGVIARGEHLDDPPDRAGAQPAGPGRGARLLRGAVRHSDRPQRRARDPVRGPVPRRVRHPRSGCRAHPQPELPREPPAPPGADRARGRSLRPSARSPRCRRAPPTTPSAAKSTTSGRRHARRSLRPGKPSRQKRPPAVLRRPGTPAGLPRAEHPPSAVRRPPPPAGRQLRDRPRPRSPASATTSCHCPNIPPTTTCRPAFPATATCTSTPSPQTWPKQDSSPRDSHAQPPCSTPATSRRATSRRRSSRHDLAAIGLRVEVKAFPDRTAVHQDSPRPASRSTSPGSAGCPTTMDPAAMLNVLLEDGTVIPTFEDPTYRARLAAAARLTGAERYLTYARLDADLARNAAPLVAFGNLSEPRPVLRADRLPDLRGLRHRPRRPLHQALQVSFAQPSTGAAAEPPRQSRVAPDPANGPTRRR